MIFRSLVNRISLWLSALTVVVSCGLSVSQVCAGSGEEAPIDAILAKTHDAVGVVPTELCDDRIYFRRLSLDLVGRVPTNQEITAFQQLGDRRDVVDSLLASDSFPKYWSSLWTTVLVGRGQERQSNREALRRWLETAIRDERPLDQIAFDLISAAGVTTLDGQVNFLVANREDPVTSVSRVFLGVQLDCARCHDHPTDRWTQEDYLAMRRFFSGMNLQEVSGGYRLLGSAGNESDPQSLPRFLTGSKPRTNGWRRELAYMTVRCKPFARAMGNRIWQLLLGRGIVDPVDGLSEQSRPTVPELHQALADQLRGNGFDLRALIRTICRSDAYARRDFDKASDRAETMARLFASRRPRALTPEQLIASYETILRRDVSSPERRNELAVSYIGQSAVQSTSSDPLGFRQTSQGLLQELSLDVPPPQGDQDQVFRTVLMRDPDPWERRRLDSVSRRDLLFVLLHCNEFVFSH